MVKGFSPMEINRAEEEFIEMYSIFKKFINNSSDIELLLGEPFCFDKVDKIHLETAYEFELTDEVVMDAIDELKELERKVDVIDLLLQRHELVISLEEFNELIKEYYGLRRILKNGNYNGIFDYYFKYNDRYYTVDMSSDLDDFGYPIANPDLNLVCCQLREFNEFIEVPDTNKSIMFIYDKEKNKVTNILDVSRYIKDELGETTIEQRDYLNPDIVVTM